MGSIAEVTKRNAQGLSTPDGKPVGVLVVDDDAAFCEIVADVLKTCGYEAWSLQDPAAAMELVARGGIVAALVDLVMPQMHGLDLVGRLHAISPDLQAIVLTGHAELDSAIGGIRQGVFAYLQKDQARMGLLVQTLGEAVAKWTLLQVSRGRLADLEEANRRLHLLHESTANLASEIHSDVLMRRVVESAREACNASSGRLLLLEPTSEGFVIQAAQGDRAESLQGARLAAGEGIVSLVLESGNIVHLADPLGDRRYSPRCDGVTGAHRGLLAAPLRHRGVHGVLLVADSRRGTFGPADEQMLAMLARQAAIALENATHHERSVNFFTHTSDILVSFLETLDIHHPGHSRGAAALADLISRRLGLSDPERRSIHFAALLHDIGKVRFGRELLNGASLSEESKRLMREHPRLGVEILRPITMWEDLLDIILSHHERWDGKGYPHGRAGEDIPVGARIVAVADAFDAMGRGTPYRQPKDAATAISDLEAGAGSQFDPRIVRLFLAAFRESGDPRLHQS